MLMSKIIFGFYWWFYECRDDRRAEPHCGTFQCFISGLAAMHIR